MTLPLRREALLGEDGFAEAEAAGVLVERDPALLKAHSNAVKLGVRQVPELDALQFVESNGVLDRLRLRGVAVAIRCRSVGDHLVCRRAARLQRERLLGRLEMLAGSSEHRARA